VLEYLLGDERIDLVDLTVLAMLITRLWSSDDRRLLEAAFQIAAQLC
jgi:hypothetical protein